MAQYAADPKFLQLWQDATNKYEDETKVKFATHALAACTHPDAVLDALDRDLREFKDYRDKKEGLRKWLKPMLHLIGSLSEAAGEATAMQVPYAKAGFVALGVLVQAAKNVSARYDSIIDLCELLHSFLERLRVYLLVQLPENMQEVVIRILAHLLSVFGLATKEIKHNRFGSYLRTLIGQTDVQELLKKLNDLIGAEQSMGVANAMVFSREILDHVQGLVLADKNTASILAHLDHDLQKAMQSTKDANTHLLQQLSNLHISSAEGNERIIKDLEDLNRRHLDSSVRSWLKAPDARTNHNTARELHDGNTGNWLLRSFEYKSWKSTSSSLFWINGKPGAGKTIICSTVIEDLLVTPGSVLAYFYFYYGEANKQSPRGMLCSIISELEEQLLHAPSPLLGLYKKLGSGAHEPSIPELTACLNSLVIALSGRPIFIVVDAVDECAKPKDLAPILNDLLHSVQGCMHVFVTSRPEDGVTKILHPLTTCELDLSSAIKGDIALHLGHVLSKEHPFCSWKQVHRDRVFTHLLEHSDGMFRWVSCQLDELRECLLRDLQDTLNSLPTTLDATYARILSRIHPQNKPHARRLFNWLAFSFHPLHFKELAQVLAINFIDDAHATYEEDCIEPDPKEAILRVCLSLVQITTDGTVQFAHFSVKEFFLSERINSMPLISLFQIEAEKAHTIIATSCLAYLLWTGHTINIGDNKWEMQDRYPLIQFSIEFADYTQLNGVSTNVHDMLVSLFIENSAPWMFWVSLTREHHYAPARSPVYWAALLGYSHVMELLCQQGADISEDHGTGGNSLQAASFGGHLKVTQMLLEYGADVNKQVVSYRGVWVPGTWLEPRGPRLRKPIHGQGNALQAASVRGHLDIALLLLEHGADVNAQGGHYGNALQAASVGGHLDITLLLLEHSANINAQGGECGSAFQAASACGHLDLVKLLLKSGAKINAQGGYYGNALQAASAGGHLDIALLLLEHGADVNAQGGHYGNALQAASVGGHLDIALLLLEHSADINALGGECASALQAASASGHLDLVKLLLEHGADINAQGCFYGNALQAASVGGHLDIALLLLKRSADINAQGGQFGNALQAASAHDHLDVVKLLLERGADINAQGGFYGNALQGASVEAHLDIALLLLEHGANINVQGGLDGNALLAASTLGHLDIVKLLLEHGADINVQGGLYGNALYAASAGGHLDVAQLLLEHGADVNAQGGLYGNALQAASEGGHLDIVRLLLARGAQINTQDG
ncbi:ankyrin repeat-containing domain protein [Mycena amicta]|nr:ankyrin repeat-containing domain protein [Mycena amicta]